MLTSVFHAPLLDVALQRLLNPLVASAMFIPHGHCYLWKPELLWLHILSDGWIALAYYSIPITLVIFVRKRQDLPFDWVFLLFGAFIVACGTTHLLEIWTLWHPTYWLSGFVKSITALVSVSTAVLLIPLVPKALALPSPALLEVTNRELEREIAERRKSEARYRAIVEDQTELITRFQPDGTLLFVNDAYCRYFGLQPDQIIGQQYQPVIYEADREKVAQAVATMSLDNPMVTIENRVIVGDGVRWTQWINRALFDQNQQFIEFQSVGRDVTERKQAEIALENSQRFIQKIADTAPVLLYVYDFIENQMIYSNRDTANLLNRQGNLTDTDNDAAKDYALRASLHLDDLVQVSEWRQQWYTMTEGNVLQREYRLNQGNGESRYFQCQETLFSRTDEGAPQQVLGVAVDITDRKMLQKLQASLKEKQVLLQEIHHRVKNNLQIVYSLLRLQTRHSSDPHLISSLLESQNRIKSIALVHEKLYRSDDIAKIDFSQYINSLAAYLFSAYKVDSNAIALETEIDSIILGIGQAVPCGLIINELVSNALKYAFPGNLRGTITITLHTQEQSQIVLCVKDNGVGLPESLDLTEPTSLGLQLVQDFVDQLDGNIQIDRSPGTTFTVTFSSETRS
ncbi:PAS domain S-box protein [Oscillatoria sp. FACHB-1407]|uniref:sensor histidine kinase n=1 Tax=Oscillatoria sp. FACHB-1407 TaxID=2692847 RepID=UPI001686D653|nr:histidine kinase dimerization/phosphoacceptor domain -containing protein [Oscillatoria sp. FACHB-1407]MBD2465060.1 PAS domain S-box protein [Oscillatoria sp. FACHB-1407]